MLLIMNNQTELVTMNYQSRWLTTRKIILANLDTFSLKGGKAYHPSMSDTSYTHIDVPQIRRVSQHHLATTMWSM